MAESEELEAFAFEDKIVIAKRERRRLERKWKKSGNEAHREAHQAQSRYIQALLSKSKSLR